MPHPRICVFSYAPISGGVSTYQAHQLAYLRGWAETALIDEVPETTLRRLAPAEAPAPTVFQVPLWTAPRHSREPLSRWLTAWRPDVVVTSNPGLIVRYRSLLAAMRRELGARVVLVHHSGILTMTWRRYAMALASSFIGSIVDEVVYVTDYTRRYWEHRYPWMRRTPHRIVHNGLPIRHDITTGRPFRSPLRLGFVGRLELEKGIDLFCETARQSRAAGCPYEFHVYGAGAWEGRLTGTFAADVIWHGHVEASDQIFGHLDLLLLTSPVENCPFASLEAMNLGVPTVAPAVGGLPEIIGTGRGGILASRRSPAALLEAIDAASRTYSALSEACLTHRWAFDLQRCGREMWAPYGAPAAAECAR